MSMIGKISFGQQSQFEMSFELCIRQNIQGKEEISGRFQHF